MISLHTSETEGSVGWKSDVMQSWPTLCKCFERIHCDFHAILSNCVRVFAVPNLHKSKSNVHFLCCFVHVSHTYEPATHGECVCVWWVWRWFGLLAQRQELLVCVCADLAPVAEHNNVEGVWDPCVPVYKSHLNACVDLVFFFGVVVSAPAQRKPFSRLSNHSLFSKREGGGCEICC